MLGESGSVLVGLAMAVAAYTAIAAFLSIRRRDIRWLESAKNAAYATAGLLAVALLLLLAAFLADVFGIQYVAAHSSAGTPLYLKISAVWAGQEGSLLLWAFLQALFTAMAIRRPAEEARPLVPWATVVLGVTTLFFVGVTLFLSNPFLLSEAVPPDGQGLNPLLRHPGMVFHPPALFLGYVGLAIPFAFAMAALLTGRLDGWQSAVRRWTLAAWLFLGLGLLLGARWAYDVLGWGGYWGWDPVENAALMPWFTSTALLHGIAMQDERRGYRAWNIVLAALSFALVLFGTFATRSGMIQSVHAFSRSPIGYYFLAFIAVVVTVSVALLVRARRAFGDQQQSAGGLLSRNGMFFLTLVLFITATATVFVGSTLPTITEAVVGQRFEAGPDWFDRVMGPQLAAMVFLIGLCPVLGRAASALRLLKTRGWPALVGALIAVIGALISGFTRWAPMVGFATIGLAMGTAVAEIARDAIVRAKREAETPARALWEIVGRNRRKYGGYIVHIGVILMALGVIGTRAYEVETDTVLAPGEQASVGRYTLFFEELRQDITEDATSVWASVAVYRDGAYLVTLQPRVNRYPGSEQNVTVPALRAGLREDLYLVLAGWREDGSTATLKVFVNPLASFLWLGGLVFMGGGAVAAWSGPRGGRVAASRGRRRALAVLGLVVGLALLVAAGVAMWGPGHGAVLQAAGRPLPGQPVPGFVLTLLDGSSLQLSDLRGEVAVVNFWASWCPPCRDEMPDLQQVWEEYQERGVTVVGVAFQDNAGPVRAMMDEFGTTYPVGLDVDSGIANSYGVTGPPETFVIDAEGRVVRVFIGPVTADILANELDRLLEGP